MYKKIKKGELNLTFAFNHKFEKPEEYVWDSNKHYYSLGLSYRRQKIVGKKGFNKPKEWDINLVNNHILSLSLILCSFVIKWDIGGMHG